LNLRLDLPLRPFYSANVIPDYYSGSNPLIDLYFWPTPNGHKASIALEEMGMDYNVHAVNIMRGDQFEQEFLRISPNNKIPAIVHRRAGQAPLSLFESGAILQYLADVSGRFLPAAGDARYKVLEWLNFQTASMGPMLGQCGHFLGYAPERIEYAVQRYCNEARRLYGVIERRLTEVEYLADEYSIADMAVFPWIRVHWFHEIELEEFPAVHRWYRAVDERPAVVAGLAVLEDSEKIGDPDEETREAFFGNSQYDQGGDTSE
jgi:GST-like protein